MEYTSFHIENPQHIDDDFRIEKINQSYKLLKINSDASLRDIQHAFRKLIIKLHPYARVRDIYFKGFINICLAYSLLRKLNDKPSRNIKTQAKLFDEWFSFEREEAFQEAIFLAGMKNVEFEQTLIPGFEFFSKNLVGITIILSAIVVIIPFILLINNKLRPEIFIYVLLFIISTFFRYTYPFAKKIKTRASTWQLKHIRQYNSLFK